MFKVASAALKWSPTDFRQSTPFEFWAAIEAAEEAAEAMEKTSKRSR